MRKNIFIYITAFIFSVFLWMYVNLNFTYSININVPLDVNMTKNQALSSDLPEFIDVNLKGKGWELLSIIIKKNIAIKLDLSTYKKDTRISLSQSVSEILNLPSSLSITGMNPDTLYLTFDNITTKMIRVRNNLRVIPKSGYAIIGDPKVSPDSVKITGAMSVLNKIKYLFTESLTIENVSSNFSREAAIKDTLTNIIKIEPNKITISYKIELSAEKNFEDIEVKILDIPADKEALLIPPKIKLYLRGGVDELSKISAQEINAYIDYRQIENDNLGYVLPEIKLPVEATVIKYEPDKFQYIIKNRNNTEQKK